ncbi:ArsR/SmtB family transcription factor [Actomonas aquatica]|uniref:Metalloregulator ArsR/SmtB family transcription factor n=1 Tax=Actomonas aquatica TaxID=2866162 RepID=A0ABZ1C5E5_9BACT|nr:metalloregulator ArsR/SmtB family transcription factor [Opitutus sp. WL0086]WRQ86568.1 metalloregulator ArsR/SmtB family transcription factor [Opitutus sp. WL0086]
MAGPGIKRLLYAQFAQVAKTLASAPRLELLELLAQRERSVEELVGLTDLPVANVSQHLQHLRRSGLVANRRDGKHIHYRLADPAVVNLLGTLQELAERNHVETARTIDRYFKKRDALEPVSRTELLRRKKAGAVFVIDVRPVEEFAEGHIPGAMHVPLVELERRLAEFPRDQEIVAYCRGPYCVLAFEAVARLRRQGYQARRLQDGFPEWKLARLPVATTAVA